MLVKCKICGEKIDRDTAYRIEKNISGGKVSRSYYCDVIEYEANIKEQEDKLKILEIIDSILGHKCVNSVIYKELANIKKGYTYGEILNSFESNKDRISELLNYNGIDKEYNMIRYIFGVISRTINDDVKEMEKKKNRKSIKKINSNEIKIDDEIGQDYEYKSAKNTADFSNFF